MQSIGLVLLSNQQALQRSMDVIANNVANASTTGFKRENVAFDTLISQPTSAQPIHFITDKATYRDTSVGTMTPTGNPLDLAIQGAGYFQVQATDGSTQYTRGGAFQVNNQGQLSTLTGHPVLGDSGQPILIPDTANDLNIGADGTITANTGGTALSQLGKIPVVTFANEQLLQAQGGGLYATTQSTVPATASVVVQGAVEQSNVSAITEMTQMIKIQRAYEQASNLMGSDSTRQADAITKLSKTTV